MKTILKIKIKLVTVLFLLSCNTESVDQTITNIVFKDVNVITMTSEEVLENKSVYISNGFIKDICDFNDLDYPEETKIIDTNGKYLTPGFNDMHVHFYDDEELSLYLVNGITTVRNMWGFPYHLEKREQIRNGEVLGPDLFTAGPLTDGTDPIWEGSYTLTDPEMVEDYVTQIKEDGYDFIKVYNSLSKEVFYRIMETANKYEIPVIGHIPDKVNIEGAINSNILSIEHFEGYEQWKYSLKELSDRIDLTVESGVWNCPTLVVMKTYIEVRSKKMNSEKSPLESIPELKYVNPETLRWWNNAYGIDLGFRQSKNLLKKLNKHGANIVSGSDHGNPYVITGFSLHEEFKLMNEAGLSPYEVLLTTTVNPAKMLGIEDQAGTIEVGKKADLVLLDKNPLIDIKNTKSIAGVMTQGKWLGKETLEIMLKNVEKSYSKK